MKDCLTTNGNSKRKWNMPELLSVIQKWGMGNEFGAPCNDSLLKQYVSYLILVP